MAAKKNTPRQDVFAVSPERDESLWNTVIGRLADPTASELLAREQARTRRGRARTWEQANRPHSYRGVPAEVRAEVLEIAGGLAVPADEVARAFLEYGLNCLERGSLELNPQPKAQRMTLYPFHGASWSEQGWRPAPPAKIRPRRQRGAGSRAKTWTERAHYRIPDELHGRLKELAGDLFPLGELVTVLLKHGAASYRAGRLVLHPHPRQAVALGWSGETQ